MSESVAVPIAAHIDILRTKRCRPKKLAFMPAISWGGSFQLSKTSAKIDEIDLVSKPSTNNDHSVRQSRSAKCQRIQ